MATEKSLVERLEAAVTRLEAAVASASLRPGAAGGAARDLAEADVDPAASDPAILAYDEYITEPLGRFSAAGEKIGGQVGDVTKVVVEAFGIQKDLLIKTTKCKKPDITDLQAFVKPLNDVISKAIKLTEGKRTEYFNHLKTVADSLSALAWVAFLGKDLGMSFPTAHVEESWQTAEFYNNKILVEHRSKDPNQVEWAKALKELYVPALRDYVKKFYPLGPVWGSAGNLSASSIHATSTPKPSPAAKAPPPPAAPSAPLFSSEKTPPQPKGGMSAVFQEISSGKPVTAGLRKVTDDMKTKNRVDRTGVIVVNEQGPRATSASSSKTTAPPKFELQMGRKWAVENQVGKKDLVIEDCDSKQSVYVYGCKDSVLNVKDKVNNITIDNCTKFGLLFKDVVASCEVVNCNRVQVQCQGEARTVLIDNSSGCELYLSKESLEASITTSKSTEVNVLVPGKDDGDWAQFSLPEQFAHIYKDGQFTTSPVYHSGA